MKSNMKSLALSMGTLLLLLGCQTNPEQAAENIGASPQGIENNQAIERPQGINPEQFGLRPLEPQDLPEGVEIMPLEELSFFEGLTPIKDNAGNIRMMVPHMTVEEAFFWYEDVRSSSFISEELLELFRVHFGLDE